MKIIEIIQIEAVSAVKMIAGAAITTAARMIQHVAAIIARREEILMSIRTA